MKERAMKRHVRRPKRRQIEPWVCAVLALALAGCASGPPKPLVSEEPARADEVAADEQRERDGKERKRYRPKLMRSSVVSGQP